ncbi:carboxymuconolactone decarboxylase family protein [Belliella marina]|uniref:Carboxymuconolactone decarboxylase family protein n=1 Tax=Belliella marina TaxID=1644146 RepID=A0ABW4VNH0_9BACT
MEKRINIQELEPKAYEAMFAMEKYLSTSSVDRSIQELIKIRASQINGCAYCIDLHTQEALGRGEDQRRIFALSAWKESALFTAQEKAVLQMTEEISFISRNGLTSETYDRVKEFFTDNEIAQIIMQIGTINMWNRIAVSTQLVQE